jgi:uncharacterized membrane protein
MTAFHLKVYLACIAGFLLLDMVWLSVVAQGFYQRQLGFLLSARVNWPAAICFYLLFVAGVLVFAVLPGLDAHSWRRAALLGAFLGLVAYGAYDLTNLATVRNWPLLVTLVDLAWGAVLTAAVSSLGYLAGNWLR